MEILFIKEINKIKNLHFTNSPLNIYTSPTKNASTKLNNISNKK